MENQVELESSKSWYWTCSKYQFPEENIRGPYTLDECLEKIENKHQYKDCQIVMQDFDEKQEEEQEFNYGDLVKVIWDDAHSAQGWIQHQDIEHFTNDPLSRCIHAGLFVKKTKEAFILTFGISSHGSIDGTIEVPLSCIVETKLLEESSLEAI